MAEALNADVRELIYGPGRIERPYARFQLRYIICTVICALILLAWLVMEWTLEPYLTRLQMEAFDVYPRLFYILLVPPLACAAAGVLIPSAISLWGDIRLRSQMLFVTAYMNLWPDFMVNCLPLRIWLATISSTGNELMRYSPMFLSGCLLFLGLNK